MVILQAFRHNSSYRTCCFIFVKNGVIFVFSNFFGSTCIFFGKNICNTGKLTLQAIFVRCFFKKFEKIKLQIFFPRRSRRTKSAKKCTSKNCKPMFFLTHPTAISVGNSILKHHFFENFAKKT